MAGNGISINILSNVREALKGTDEVADALDEVVDTLHDMTKEGDKSAERMERDFRDLAREADDTADAIKSKMRDAFKSVSKASRDATDDVEKFGANARDELQDSAREGAQSFTGEFEDIQDVLQETVANLGPGGIVGAAAIGAIAAVATQAVEAWNEKIEGIKEATAEMWQEAAAEGQSFLDASAIQAEAHRILWDDAYKADMEAAEKAGVTRAELAVALAEGEGATFDKVHKAFMQAREDEARKTDENYDKYTNASEGLIRLESAEGKEIGNTITILDEKARAVEDNKRKADDAAAATKTLHEQERAQIERTRAADQRRYEAMAERYGKQLNLKLGIDTSAADAALASWRRRNAQHMVKITGKPVATWD